MQTASGDDDPKKRLDIQARRYRAALEKADARRADLDAEVAEATAAGVTTDEIEAVLVLAGLDPDQLDPPPLATG
ncbi:hypothetical protein OHA72_15570 [Dactylosporangium sp. NBC_01737]|uniref:hypothetical protein n=1 Tax=Dactylosporangium sp. NBC_01737 TaxID=2975959 RepID=UPI002E0F9224|nr:hypothetical protein OHA72_15570 [Dactylosporangium sp. NBC_01737]